MQRERLVNISRYGWTRRRIEHAVSCLVSRPPFTIRDVANVASEDYRAVEAVFRDMVAGGFLSQTDVLPREPGRRGPVPIGYAPSFLYHGTILPAVRQVLFDAPRPDFPIARFTVRDLREQLGLPPARDRAIRYALFALKAFGQVHEIVEVDLFPGVPGRPPGYWTADRDAVRDQNTLAESIPMEVQVPVEDPAGLRWIEERCRQLPQRRYYDPEKTGLPVHVAIRGNGIPFRSPPRPLESRPRAFRATPSLWPRDFVSPAVLYLFDHRSRAFPVAHLANETGMPVRRVRRDLHAYAQFGMVKTIGAVQGASGPNPPKLYCAAVVETPALRTLNELLLSLPPFFTVRELALRLGTGVSNLVPLRLALLRFRGLGRVECCAARDLAPGVVRRRGTREWWTATPAIIQAIRRERATPAR